MAFVYRYIDLKKKEVVYIGKVTKEHYDFEDHIMPLIRRHKQHLNTDKDWCNKNLILQFMEMCATDADIYETYLISKYCETGQLYNRAKMWGKTQIEIKNERYNWSTYGANSISTNEAIKEQTYEIINHGFHSLEYGIDFAEKLIIDGIKEIFEEKRKLEKFKDVLNLAYFETDGDFKRKPNKCKGCKEIDCYDIGLCHKNPNAKEQIGNGNH